MPLPIGEPPPPAWRRAWQGLPLPAWRYFARLPSTQDAARTWAQQGAAEGCLVYAEAQTRGRGRAGRRWYSRPAAALTFTLVLRPLPGEGPWLGRLAGWAAVALCQVLEQDLNLHPRIKWPNDVLVEGRKVAGILIEAPWEAGPVPPYVLVGIGINVKPEALPPAEVLDFPATALERHTAAPVDRPRLLARLWEALYTWRYRLPHPDLLRAWEERLAYRGQRVHLVLGETAFTACLLGLTETGALRVRLSSGEERILPTVLSLRPLARGKGPESAA